MPAYTMSSFAKRSLDLIVAIVVLLLSSPFLAFAALAIKFTSQGPVFFKQERIGRNWRRFQMVKFRSMEWNAPDLRNPDGSTFNAESDPRVTGLGRWLRKTSFDELPQLWNVLRGEMSLVGPRPELPDGVQTYLPGQFRRLDVRPGMTGWAVVHGRNDVPVSQRRDMDAWYARHVSFWLDLKIITKTIVLVVRSRGVNGGTSHLPAESRLETQQCSTEN